MFSCRMKESNQKVLNLQSATFKAMSVMLDYFYNREIVRNDENVLDLNCKTRRASYLWHQWKTRAYNCSTSKMVLTEQFGAEKLVQRANNYIKTNFSGAVNDEESMAHFIGLSFIGHSRGPPRGRGLHVPVFPVKTYSCSLVPQK